MSAPPWLSWSGGKDAALALRALRTLGERAAGLVCTFDERTGRVPIHGVPVRLLEGHARALGLELLRVPLPSPCPNEVYLERLGSALGRAGVRSLAFGDLHLGDIRAWREENLAALGVEARFPLFGRDPAELFEELRSARIEATLCSIDTTRLDPAFLGRAFDASLIAELPEGCDRLGENGEFHTLVLGWGGERWLEEAPEEAPVWLDERHLALDWADRESGARSDAQGT